MWEMYWWPQELNMLKTITKLFPACEIFNTGNIPTIHTEAPQALFLTVHSPFVNCRPSRKLLFASRNYVLKRYACFLFYFLLDVILLYMLWCFLGYHWTSSIKLVKRVNCKPMWSNQGDQHPLITRLHKSALCLSSRVGAQATFFQTRSTLRGTQFKRFWPRLSWMFSHLTKRKLRLQSIVKSRLLEPSALELVSLTLEHSLSNNVKGNHLSRPRARIIQLRVKQCDNGAKLLLTSVFLRQFKASWSRL